MLTKRISAFFLFLVLLCLMLTGNTLAQGNSIRGKLRNSAGRNVAQAIVELESGNGQPVNTTVTNNEGDFSFVGLAGTSYIIIIRQIDYEPLSEHVDFVRTVGPDDPGEQRTVQLTLTPRGGNATIPSNRVVSGQNVPKAAREALERAIKLTKDNKSQDAVTEMQAAIGAYPDYFEAHLLLGGEYLKMDRLADAITEFERARKINPKDDRVYQGFGQALMRQKKYALASQVFGEAWRLNPTDPNILLMRASALLEHALATNPNASKEAAAERDKSFSMAERDFMKVLELGGNRMARVHLQLARLYEKKGDRARAAAEMEQYLKIVPDDKKADAIRSAIKTLRAPASEKKS